QQEHERSEALSRELGTVRAKLTEVEAWQSNASAQADELKKPGARNAAELRKSAQQEQAGAEQRDLVSERTQTQAPITGGVASAGLITRTRGTEAVLPDRVNLAPAREAPNNSDDGPAVERLFLRASALLGQGDIGSARIVLERAAESGSAKATFALAETYDPLILPKWGTFGTRGDVDKARELYAKAEAVGNNQAKQRLDALR
ncbi:MAG TPA: hypothetical protein VJV58_02720, partial [Bradyrhizobium sp.]|nr:hypothetical protein [Bradyrhizobium sp.]